MKRFDPKKALFVKGHCHWGPGQLEAEISQGVWYTAAVSSSFILRLAGAPCRDNSQDPCNLDIWADIRDCMRGFDGSFNGPYNGPYDGSHHGPYHGLAP